MAPTPSGLVGWPSGALWGAGGRLALLGIQTAPRPYNSHSWGRRSQEGGRVGAGLGGGFRPAGKASLGWGGCQSRA